MTVSELRPKVLWIGSKSYAKQGWENLSKVAQVEYCTSKDRQEFLQDLKGKYQDVVSIARSAELDQTGRFDEELISALPSTVKTISHCGAGYDQIDVEPLVKRNIQLSNITTPVEAPTADTAIFLVLSALRNFQESHDLLLQGQWTPTRKSAGAKLGHLPGYKTIGILGMGGIGRAIRDRLLPFGFKKILYHNRSRLAPELEKGCEYLSFDDLLAQSDILCISVPLNAKTHHLIDKSALEKMKNDSIIINTARGAVIDEKELTEKLKLNEIGAFGTDVFEFEPKVPQELLELPNVVSLPHMGTHAHEAHVEMEEFVVENIKTFLYTGKLKTIVPEMYSVEFNHEPILSQ